MKFLNSIFKKEEIEYLGYIYTATGIFGHSFKHGDSKVFSINSMVTSNPTLYLNGFDQELLHKNFDGEITLIPGVCRKIEDKFGDLHGCYEYINATEYVIRVKNKSVLVKVTENGWHVYINKKILASVNIIPSVERNKFQENGYEMELAFVVNISPTVDTILYPYIMSIPMLRF